MYSSSQGCHTATGTHVPHGITWDHTVLPATRQRWHSRPYPSRSWYSIKRPRRDARLSWPSHAIALPALMPIITAPHDDDLPPRPGFTTVADTGVHLAAPGRRNWMHAPDKNSARSRLISAERCFPVNFSLKPRYFLTCCPHLRRKLSLSCCYLLLVLSNTQWGRKKEPVFFCVHLF